MRGGAGCQGREGADLDQSGGRPEAHLGHGLALPPPRQAAEAGAGAGEGAERGGTGSDGGLGHAVAVHLLHHSEGTAPGQGIHDLGEEA